MIDKLLSIFGVNRVAMITGIVSNIIKAFDQEFAQNHDAKKAAIEALVVLLNHHKDTIIPPK